MAMGYIGKGWMDTVPTARHPSRIMNRLQCMIWMEFFEPLRQNSNELLHQQKNNYERAEDTTFTEQLEWYQSNQHTLLAHYNHFLLNNINTTMLHTMPSRQKREWIRHLTVAKLANTQELTLLKTNQHSLFRYMIPVNAPPTATPGALLPRENQTTQNNKTGKPQTGGNTTQTRSHTSHKQQITCSPTMPRKEPTLRMEPPLPEGQVG